MIPRHGSALYHRSATEAHALALAPRIEDVDLAECEAFGHSAFQAMVIGMQNGPALTAFNHRDEPIGMFGVTRENVIWSLWAASLSVAEQLQIMRLFPRYLHILRAMAEGEGPLFNWMLCSNLRAKRWLEASGQFDFGKPVELKGDGRLWQPFQTKGKECVIPSQQ
jgi:hypothetical protein